MSFLTRSPLRSQRLQETLDDQSDKDIEGGDDDDSGSEDVFDIPPKKPSIESLKKWRQATLVLNASRRFRYTLDFKNREEELQNVRVQRFRTSTHALRAIQRFKEAGAKLKPEGPFPEGFELRPGQLALMIQEQNLETLTDLEGVEGLGKLLHIDLEKGIDDIPEELQRRKLAFGENTYPRKPPKNFLVFLWEACQDTTLIILMVCAGLSLTLGMIVKGPGQGWYDGVSIIFAVFLVITVTASSDYKQSLQFQSLSEEKRNIQIQVVRGGRRLKVSIYELVVGDVVPLQIGDQVPADGVLIVGHSLVIDESSMTGESELVNVDAKHPFLMAGCKVADGYGNMLVTCVGTDTEWGQIMASISDDTGEETPLQVRLNGVATFIGQIGLTVAVIVFIMLFVRYFAQDFKRGNTKALTALRNVVDILSIAVTIVVVAVPEGLPLAVTLTLAYSMRKMTADKSLVRHLAACETMGSATTICSDKTGTLTMNEMSVVKAWVAGDLRGLGETKNMKDSVLSVLKDGIGHNCNASVYYPKEGGDAEVSGSPTEKALLCWGLKLGLDFDLVRSKSTILRVETFNSTKKRAGVAIKAHTGEVFVHWKGAAEIILELSEKWMDLNGSEVMLTDEKTMEISNIIDEMAGASLRCVALGYRRLDVREFALENEQGEGWKLPDKGLVFAAVVGIKDPCRPGVPEVVATCQAAGVKVRMVTGDSLKTAKAIARECGILTDDGLVVEGKDFRSYSDEERINRLPKIDVLARSSPTDKLLLVKTLREMNEVVAVTGDGTNDAAALHEADIGLSMGISGTEVAKESSDIIILDDNFASVVKVVRWGRSVYANIQKFIQFQLTVNVVALVINFVAAAKSEDVPLTTVQLLWVNLLMDTLGALALATEPPTDALMQKRPVGRRQPLITNVMWRNILGQAVYQLAVLLTIYFKGNSVLRLKGERELSKNTIIFNSFVFCQLFNEINSRKPEDLNIFKGIFQNSLFCGVLLVTSTLQVIFVIFLKKFFKTTSLSLKQWLICICIGAISLPIGFLAKLVPVREKPYLNTVLKRRRRGQRSSKRVPSRSSLKPERLSVECEQ